MLSPQAANCVWALGTLHGKLGVKVTEVGLSPEERRQRRPLRTASSDYPTGADVASPSRPAEKAVAVAAGRGDAAWRDSLEGMQVLKGGFRVQEMDEGILGMLVVRGCWISGATTYRWFSKEFV